MGAGKSKGFVSRGLIVSLAIFAAFIVAFLLIFGDVGRRSEREQAKLLEEAVQRGVVACYAIEGRYPASAEYLRENYALRYDENRFIISLDAFAANVRPDVRVLTVGEVIP